LSILRSFYVLTYVSSKIIFTAYFTSISASKQCFQNALAYVTTTVIYASKNVVYIDNCRTALTSQDFIINNMKEIFENAMRVAGLTKEDVAKAALVSMP
jgi:hypothetical protein